MRQIRKLSTTKRIALVAHDNKKKDLIEWAFYNRTLLSQHELIATVPPENYWKNILISR
jgi:methylglyoxal synthase